MRSVIDGLGPEDSGTFQRYNGTTSPGRRGGAKASALREHLQEPGRQPVGYISSTPVDRVAE
jgi:hypothetical protein